jgi:uncharacterized membrane protein
MMDEGRRPDGRPGPIWPGAAAAALALAAVVTPAVVYQVRHFMLAWHDVGTYVRVLWNFFDHGRFALYSNGTGDFFIEQHFEPFLFVLALPVRLGGTLGYVTLITAALAVSAGYVFALSSAVSASRWIGGLAAAAYVANPYTYSIAISYHVETFGILFLLAFAYYSYAGRARLAWLALLLALAVKEDMWLYACVAALLVARRERIGQAAAFVAAAVAYYAIVILLIGGWLYPTAHYLSAFYKVNDQPQAKMQIAAMFLGRWREYLALLVTGPGLWFQLSLLFVGLLSGWRSLLTCAVMLIWLTYPDRPGEPLRSTLTYYYSYSALALSFVALPFALRNLRRWCDRFAGEAAPGRAGVWAVTAAMAAVVATDVVMHMPAHVPPFIAETVNPRVVFGPGPGVNAGVVRQLIAEHLPAEAGGVLSQFYIIPMIPQRHVMYITLHHRAQFLEDRLRPRFVLLDLDAKDPSVPKEDLDGMVNILKNGGHYQAIYDDGRVLLYRRREP